MDLAAPFDARTRLGLVLPMLVVVVIGIAVTAATASRSQDVRDQALERFSQAEANTTARILSLRLQQDGHAIERMGARLAVRGGAMPESEWRADAGAYLSDKPWLRALYVADETGVQWVEPEGGPAMAGLVGAPGGPGRNDMSQSDMLGRLHAGAVARFEDGSDGMMAYYPFADGTGGVRVLVALFDIAAMLRASRPAYDEDFDVALTASTDGPRLAGSGRAVDPETPHRSSAPITTSYEVGWTLHTAPTASFVRRMQPRTALGVWMSGIGLTLLGASLAFMAQLARRQADRLADVDAVRRTSEQRYNLVVRGMAVGVWDWGIRDNTLGWSPNAMRMLGLPQDHRVTDASFFFDRIHLDDQPAVREAIEAHFEMGEPYAPNFRMRHENGHFVWCHATGQVLLDETGEPVRMAGSIEDITEERAAEEARNRSERRLRAVTQSAVDAVLTTNAQGIIEEANPACERVFGYRPDELVGSNIRILTPTEHRRKHDYYIKHYIETGDSDIVGKVREVYGVHRDGHAIPIELAVTEYKAGDDRIFIATARDLSARKAGEAEREAFIARLEQTNAELERFSFAASHDLREPLRMIGNFSQMLLRKHAGQLDEDARKAVEICAGSAQRMQALLDDLISFSRASDDLGQIETFIPVDMIELARQNLAEDFENSQASLETVHLPAKLRTNPTRFSRVFQNLIANSIKYAKDGEAPKIQISAAPYEQGWLFTLSDKGIGMRPEYCEQIFEPFKRLHPASKYSGTGMGLAICRKIVNNAGGRIWAESEVGEGSRFYVYWPEAPQDTDAAAAASTTGPDGTVTEGEDA